MKKLIVAVICIASVLLMSGCQVSEKQRAEIEAEVRAELEEELREELEKDIRKDILNELKKEGVIPEDYGEKDDSSSGSISFDFGMSDYVRQSRVTSACSTARSIETATESCMTKLDTMGIGAVQNEISYIGVEIKDGVWNATIGNLGAFRSNDSYEWSNDPDGFRAGDSKDSITNPEVLLEAELAEMFPDMEDGYSGMLMDSGRVLFLYFTSDTTSPVDEMERLIDSGEYASGIHDWSGGYPGYSDKDYIIGTSPVLAMKE